MKRVFTVSCISTVAAVLATGVLIPTAASAVITANDADDVCAPTADPCVINEAVDVFGTLDFGLRTVHVTGGGRLRGEPDVFLLCGELFVDVGGGTSTAVLKASNDGGFVSITVRRACSGDGTTPCTTDSSCAEAGLGTCSVGNGSATIDGRISATGAEGGDIDIIAAGDITLLRTINVSATGIEGSGGQVNIRSRMGSVTTAGSIKSTPGAGQYYGLAGGPGEVELRAALDVVVTGQIQVNGGFGEGNVRITAGRDFIARAGINCDAGNLEVAHGGQIYIDSARNIMLEPSGGQLVTRFRTDGGGARYFYGYGGTYAWQSGYGGYQYLVAANDITLQQNTFLQSQGGQGYGPGGALYLYASNTIQLDGEIVAQAIGPEGGRGGIVRLTASNGVGIGPSGKILTNSPSEGGQVFIDTDGPTLFYGLINVRALATGEYSYASSGEVVITGDTDAVIGGTIVGGGVQRNYDVKIDVCRLTITKTGKIDLAQGELGGKPNVRINIRESMTAEAKSKIITDPEAVVDIRYRDPNKPPVLAGEVTPTPILSVNPSLIGCPVCGNLEIDQDESCDDGNTTSGDGCRDDCQDEGCIADTVGFPTTPLCDDGDACTLNTCDPVGHQCLNPVSCEEGVACTVDTCVAGACEHTPDDLLCDDSNDCTIDSCNATSGCQYSGLSGDPCEDGDMCTVTGTCQSGSCAVTDVSLTENHKIRAKLKPGAANDLLKVKLDMPLSDFAADPTLTGVYMELFDADDGSVFAATLEAADWVDKRGDSRQFSFSDTQGPAGPANGVSRAKIKRIDRKGVARASVKMRGTEIPGAADQLQMTLSLLFGIDPATDDCLTARRVPCKVSATRTSCR